MQGFFCTTVSPENATGYSLPPFYGGKYRAKIFFLPPFYPHFTPILSPFYLNFVSILSPFCFRNRVVITF